jgi:parallel beta-helix repeat protein
LLRITRPFVVLLVLATGTLGNSGLAAAQPPGPQGFDNTACTPVNAAGYQLCTSEKGTAQQVVPPAGAPFYTLSLTGTRELKHNGALLHRSEEQHLDLDLTRRSAGSQGEASRAGVVVAGDVTCTFDDSAAVVDNGVRRTVSNLACTSATAARSAAKAAPLPTYSDYSAVNTAPNGLATPIRYGTVGKGNPKTDDCTVTTTTNPQAAVKNARAGAVICVKPGNYSTATLTVDKAVTVRANGVVSLKNIVVTGSNAVVDGFNVVGGTLGNPNYAIKFSGTGHKIVNNLVRGRGIWYAIGCEQSAGCGRNVLIAGNTITGVHNFGIFLWGGDRITVEKNNVFDLFQSQSVDDVDAMRAWGTNHVVRNNYFHDINAGKSAGSPHSDCYQSYQASGSPRLSSNILYENNYCVRVTGQCFIAQNNLRNAAELHDYVIRGNVCETYGWQTIEMTGIPNITMDNDYVASVQGTVLNFTNAGGGGKRSTNVKVRNSVLVRATSGSRYVDGTPADNTANRTLVDPAVKSSHDAFARSTTVSYPPVKPTDFTSFYRDSVGRARPTVVGAGSTPNSTGLATDVDGAARVQGGRIDVGPFEYR